MEIITERLRLRPYGADDLLAFVAYRSNRSGVVGGEWCSLRIYAVLRREWEAAPAAIS